MSEEVVAETGEERQGVSDEARALEEVINAFHSYANCGRDKILRMIQQMRQIPQEHQIIVGGKFKEHTRIVKERMDHNQMILKMISNYSADMFADNHEKAVKIHQGRRPSPDFQSKVYSTLRQISREWSSYGAPEREATFTPIIEELERLYPKSEGNRDEIRILVPGCGLGRLAHDLILEGFTVQGNEFSYFMLLTSCFILNACREENNFTIYPFIFDKSNCWDYEDQLRAVTFPDRAPSASNPGSRKNVFSMCAGDFLEIVKDTQFEVVCTAWFIDTAHNIIDYINAIWNALTPGGTWINVGPLTWHWEDVRDEASIELPYSEIIRIIREKGFEVSNEKKIDSKYTVNRQSMLQNHYICAYFCARKPSE